jgi:putative tryptophan/tyrosine transport system substrate-binding protein
MNRRTFVLTLGSGLLGAPGLARAQGRKMARVGWVGAWYSRSGGATFLDAFRQGMRERGYIEGQNLTIDARWMESVSPDEAASITAELVRSKVDVIVAQGASIFGVKAAAGSVPVLFGYSGDPVAAKLVASLARPGGNLTGITFLTLELAGKRVELLKEAAPRISRLAILFNPPHIGEEEAVQETQAATRRLGLPLQAFAVHSVAEVTAALDTMVRDRINGVVALPNALIMLQRNAIAEFAVRHRVPTISGWEDFAVVDGNLMTYGPNLQEAWRYLATLADKVLKGTKPGDLPVERPTTYQLIINLKTAKALGLAIPPSLMLRADRLIE